MVLELLCPGGYPGHSSDTTLGTERPGWRTGGSVDGRCATVVATFADC